MHLWMPWLWDCTSAYINYVSIDFKGMHLRMLNVSFDKLYQFVTRDNQNENLVWIKKLIRRILSVVFFLFFIFIIIIFFSFFFFFFFFFCFDFVWLSFVCSVYKLVFLWPTACNFCVFFRSRNENRIRFGREYFLELKDLEWVLNSVSELKLNSVSEIFWN